jgi:proline racemase
MVYRAFRVISCGFVDRVCWAVERSTDFTRTHTKETDKLTTDNCQLTTDNWFVFHFRDFVVTLMKMTNPLNWQPPSHWTKITTVDMHTGGEPLRIIVDGLPELHGNSVLAKRRYFREHYDHIRTGLMGEPRGHADMYGAVLTSSIDADFDAFFLHNEGYSTMCGHAIIALTKFVLETGLTKKSQLKLNVPAGTVRASANIENGEVREASFLNVPSYLYLRDQHVDVPNIGRIRFDVAYGGAFYAFVEAKDVGLTLSPDHFTQIIDYGRRIKQAVMQHFEITHPFENDLSFLYGTIFTGPAMEGGHHSRNVCIFADGELDRSATGSGVSARAALHYAKGDLLPKEQITIESILGSTMSVEVAEVTRFGPYDAIVPLVSGTASFIGRNEFYFDPEDSFNAGFIFR